MTLGGTLGGTGIGAGLPTAAARASREVVLVFSGVAGRCTKGGDCVGSVPVFAVAEGTPAATPIGDICVATVAGLSAGTSFGDLERENCDHAIASKATAASAAPPA